MKKPDKKIILSVAVILAVAAAVFVYLALQIRSDRTVVYDYEADVASVAQYDQVIRFAGGTDFSPFAYLDENGNPCGRDVELAFALGRIMGCRVEVTLGDWTEMQEGLKSGKYDVLLTVDYSEERSKIMGYTRPTCLDSYVFFGKDDSLDLCDLSKLNNMRIAALDGGGATDNYLSPLGLLDNTHFYDTQLEAFESVVDGTNDLAIAGYIYGSNIISANQMDLVQVGTPLYGSAYYFTYDIYRLKLGTKLNYALIALEQNGTLDAIEEKWTTHYQPNLTLREYLTQNKQKVLCICAVAFLLILAIAAVLFFRNRRHEAALRERDPLTTLYNIRAFSRRARILLQRDEDTDYVLIRLDLDNFRAFNHTQGTAQGDILLKSIGAALLKLRTQNPDIVLAGHLSADHFVMLARAHPTADEPDALLAQLHEIILGIYPGYRLSACMGICPITDKKTDMNEYIDRALIALRNVKNDYYHRWAIFDSAIQHRLDEERLVEEQMRSALENGRFIPFFQPQYDYASGKICGAEALARWKHETLGFLPPSAFIPVFEKNGFIYEMDKAIWRSACRHIRSWKEQGIAVPPISVNISRSDIYHTDLINELQRILREEGVSLQELHLEITESAYLENGALLIDTVEKLHQLGAYVEMDDFGSGYSSLSVLKDIPFDALKLDMSLLKNNSLAGKDAALLGGIVRLGQGIETELLAEGVEYTEQAEYLHSLGCDRMQGYLFSRALSPEEFRALLQKTDS